MSRLEGSISQFLISRKIRERTAPVIRPWMFQTDCYRALALILCSSEYRNSEISESIILARIQNDYKDLRDSDYRELEKLFSTYEEPSETEEVYIFGIIEDFIKKALYWKGSDFLRLDNLKEAQHYFNRAQNFSLEKREYINLANSTIIKQQLKEDYPEDGKFIKSTFGLINQNTTYKGYRRGDLIGVCAPPGVGKCLGYGTKVVMYDGGLKEVQDIIAGDRLIGPDSLQRTVESVTQGRELMYWVRQENGIDYRVNESHILSLTDNSNEISNISILDYLSLDSSKKESLKGYSVSLDFEVIEVWKPYVVGTQLLNLSKIKEIELYKGRYLPREYLLNSREHRLELLAGILDTYGTLDGYGGAELESQDAQIIEDITFLSRSLGFKVLLDDIKLTIQQVVGVVPFRVLATCSPNSSETNTHLSDISVERDIVDNYYGFTLKEDPLFLLEDFTVTHNTSVLSQETSGFIDQGLKVGYAIIGDNRENDIFLKICSNLSGDSVSEVIENIDPYIRDYENILKNVNVISYAAGAVTVSEILSDFKEIKEIEGLDILMIDYDANIAAEDDSMYTSGGIIYMALKAFAQLNNCVVFVAAQPKMEFYSREVLPLESVSESGKKQHALDLLMTLNVNQDSKVAGSLFLAKVRRGTTGVMSRVELNLSRSQILEVSESDYQSTINSQNKGSSTNTIESLGDF